MVQVHAPNRLSLSDKEQKLQKLVLERAELSDRRYKGQRGTFRTLNRYYLSLSPRAAGRENDQPTESKSASEPDLFVPLFFTLVEQAVPEWLFQVLGPRPYLKVYGRTQDDHRKATGIQNLIDYDFTLANIFLRSVDLAKNIFKYGTGIWKAGYKYDAYEVEETFERDRTSGLDLMGKLIPSGLKDRFNKKRSVVRYDGPWLDVVSPYNFRPDPLYSTIEEMRYVVETRYTDLGTLKRENEQFKKLTGKDLYKNLDKVEQTQSPTVDIFGESEGDDIGEAMGWSSAPTKESNQYVGRGTTQQKEQILRVDEYWTRDFEDSKGGDRVVYLVNGELPIMNRPNWWEDKDFPYGGVNCFPIEGEFWGQGILHPNQRIQEELNSHRNLYMRNLQMMINQVWIVDSEVDVPPNANYFDPGDIVQGDFINGKPPAQPLYPQRQLGGEAFHFEDRMIQDAQRAVGSNSMIEPTADTATEAELLRSGSAIRERLQAALGEEQFLVPLAKKFLSRRQQFFSREFVVRVLGAEGVEFTRMTPEDIHGEFDFMPTGSSLAVAPNVLRQQLEQAILLRSRDPEIAAISNPETLYEELIKSFDFRQPERFIRKPPERTWTPERENIILLAGEFVEVEINDDHEAHIEGHQEALFEAVNRELSQEVMEGIREHIRVHEGMLAQQQTAPAPQEQEGIGPGGPGGEVPNLGNAVPTEASLNAGMRG